MKVLEKFENIICPICNGNGKIQCSKRLNCYEDQSWEEKCNYCNGKRIVLIQKLVEFLD